MSDTITICRDEIWVQKAQIVSVTLEKEGEETDNDRFELKITNIDGEFTNKTTMVRHLFIKQFFPEDEEDDQNYLFVSKIRIEDIEDGGKSFLVVRLNNENEQLGDTFKLRRDIILNTYYLPQEELEQM